MVEPAVEPVTGPALPAAPAGSPTPSAPADDARTERTVQLRAAATIVGAMAIVGAVLGIVWEAWSPPGPAGVELPAGIQADETEAFAAGDGRFVIMTLLVGIAAGIAAWYLRRARGPYVALGLAVGGIAGAALTELVGWALRGQGSTYKCGDGTFTCIDHLPLTVHMHALWFLEGALGVLVYALFTAFAVADDLGRPDSPAARREQPVPPGVTGPPGGPGAPAAPMSVGPQGQLQHRWTDGDAAGTP